MPNITITFNSDEVSLATSVLQFIDGNNPLASKPLQSAEACTTKQIAGQAARLGLKQTTDVEPIISPKSDKPSTTSAASSGKITYKVVRAALADAKKEHGEEFVMVVLQNSGGEDEGTLLKTLNAMGKDKFATIMENLEAALSRASDKITDTQASEEPVKGASMFDETDAKAEATEADDLSDDLDDDLDDDLGEETAATIDPEAVVKAVRAFAKLKSSDEAKAAMKAVGAKNTRAIPDLSQAKLAELLKLVA